MVHWAWLIPAAIAGGLIGMFALAVVSADGGDDE